MDWEKQQDRDAPRGGYVPLTPDSAPASGADGLDGPVDSGRAPEHQAFKKKRAALVAALLVLLVAAGVAVFVWLNVPHADDAALETDPNVKVGSITGNVEDLDKIVDEGMLTFSINSTPVFQNGTAPGNLMIENPEINNNRFTVKIVRDDTGETVYRSGALDPGQYIDDVPLDVDLEPGEYACTATFSTYRIADDSAIGQAAAGLTVTVLE